MRSSTVRIGLSGWNYPEWRKGFYEGVPQRRWLAHCAERFGTIEANGTFYKLVKPETARRWSDQTPPGFAFVVKGHRWVTHMKRLNDPGPPVVRQRNSVKPLMPKLAAVLWQLPPDFRRDDGRLGGLIQALRAWDGPRHVVEFRHESWHCDAVARILADGRIANCLSDSPRWRMWEATTTDLVYVRLHGHSRLYASRYSTPGLREWARRIRGWRRDGRTVYVYFDNDGEGHAPYDALRLMELLGDD